MRKKQLDASVVEYLARNGRKGGSVISVRKMRAVKKNLEKARRKRWPPKGTR